MQGVKRSDTLWYREDLQRRRSVFKTTYRPSIISSDGYKYPVSVNL